MSDEQADQAATLAALARDIERATRRVAELTERADELDERADRASEERDQIDDRVQKLTETVRKMQQPSGPPVGSWLLNPPPSPPNGPPPPSRADILDDLAAWMSRVYLRFPDATLPSCWAWHPCVIEELLWLRRAHHEAHAARVGTAGLIGRWHDQFRPGVVRRVSGYLHGCELPRHRDGKDRCDQGPPQVPLAAYLPVIAATWDDRRGFPDPLASMLDEAARHDVPVPL